MGLHHGFLSVSEPALLDGSGIFNLAGVSEERFLKRRRNGDLFRHAETPTAVWRLNKMSGIADSLILVRKSLFSLMLLEQLLLFSDDSTPGLTEHQPRLQTNNQSKRAFSRSHLSQT